MTTYPKPWLLSRALLGSHEENQPVYCSWLEQVICSGFTDPASKPSGLWYGHSAGGSETTEWMKSPLSFLVMLFFTQRPPGWAKFTVTTNRPAVEQWHTEKWPMIIIKPFYSLHPFLPHPCWLPSSQAHLHKAPTVSRPSVTHIPS